jgi:hypothetical protein
MYFDLLLVDPDNNEYGKSIKYYETRQIMA